MTLTPKQFNKLVTKDEHQKLEKTVEKLSIDVVVIKDDLKNFVTKDEFKKGKEEILDAIDGLTEKVKTNETERAANLGAHKRIQEDVNEVRDHVGLKIKNATL